MEYITAKDIAARLSCSEDAARTMMRRMPCLQIGGRGKGRMMRVLESDFQEFLKNNTIPACTPLPRATPYSRPKQQAAMDLKEWHRAKRAAQGR